MSAPARPTAPATALALASRVEHVDTLVREPMLVEHPSGALFVAGYNRRRPGLWKSADRGATWARVDVGSAAQGAVGNSDVDLAVAPDGTLYFVSMTYDSTADEGRGVAIGVSHDVGATWAWTRLSEARFDDRPWVAVAPDGTAHVVWNDGRGVNYAASRDGGRTWARHGRVHDRGGSSHLAIGPRGEIAVRVAPGSASGNVCDKNVDLVVISVDGGAMWQPHAAPGGPRPSGCLKVQPPEVARWVDPVAWDRAGALYALWTTVSDVWLGRSLDRGATWTTWRVAAETPDTAFYPYVVARGPGELAATWFAGAGDSLHWRAARIDVPSAAGAPPRVALSAALPLESWGGRPPALDTGGEYLAAALLADGSLAVVTPIQHEAAHRLGFALWRFGRP